MKKYAAVLLNRGILYFPHPQVCGLSRVYRRVIRRYFRSIGIPHHIQCVHLVYQIAEANGEETLNEQKRIYKRNIKWDIHC